MPQQELCKHFQFPIPPATEAGGGDTWNFAIELRKGCVSPAEAAGVSQAEAAGVSLTWICTLDKICFSQPA
jgi:hypothetical protein